MQTGVQDVQVGNSLSHFCGSYTYYFLWTNIKVFSELGEEWSPAVLNSKQELNFIREGLKVYGDIWSYYIGGSADADRDTIEYSDYYLDESGNYFILFPKVTTCLWP